MPICFFVVFLAVSLRVQGSAYRPVFTKSLRSLAVGFVTGRLTNSPTLHSYTGPIYRVFDQLGRRMIFKVAGAGIELRLHSSG